MDVERLEAEHAHHHHPREQKELRRADELPYQGPLRSLSFPILRSHGDRGSDRPYHQPRKSDRHEKEDPAEHKGLSPSVGSYEVIDDRSEQERADADTSHDYGKGDTASGTIMEPSLDR